MSKEEGFFCPICGKSYREYSIHKCPESSSKAIDAAHDAAMREDDYERAERIARQHPRTYGQRLAEGEMLMSLGGDE